MFKNFGKIERGVAFLAAIIGLVLGGIQIAQLIKGGEAATDLKAALSAKITDSTVRNNLTSFDFTVNRPLPAVSAAWVCSGKVVTSAYLTQGGDNEYALSFPDHRGAGIWTVRLNHTDNTTTSFEADLFSHEIKQMKSFPEVIICE